MGRRLPWEVQSSKEKSKPPRSKTTLITTTASSASKVAEALAEKECNADQRPPAALTSRKRAHSRTPSTSPPPGPPPISPLREGYAEDDLYIMVEDELYSVAQSYTAHLHHAEYKRLMRKAKDAPPKELTHLSPSKPRNVRDRARRDALSKQQQSALNAMVSRIGEGDDEDDADAGDGGDAARKRRKPAGSGRGLAGLMNGSQQIKTSLVGLQRLPSSTRAAMGYGKAVAETTAGSRDDNSNSNIASFFPGSKDASRSTYTHKKATRYDKELNIDKEEEHRGSWEKKKKLTGNRGEEAFQLKTKHDSEKRAVQPSTTTHAAKSKRSLIDELEDSLDDSPALPAPPSVLSSRSAPRKETRNARSKTSDSVSNQDEQARDKKSRKDRLAEVPVFMF